MKTLQEVLNTFKNKCIDGRDAHRLLKYVKPEQATLLGLTLKEDYTPWEPKEFTKENILADLKGDLAFAFNKALNRRGISSELMYNVIMQWNWILDNELQSWPNEKYALYGLPLFKATALLYGFDNPIGDNAGTEHDLYGDSAWDYQ